LLQSAKMTSYYNELGYLVGVTTSKTDTIEQPTYSSEQLAFLTTASSGQTVYNTSVGAVQFYDGSSWLNLAVPSYSSVGVSAITGAQIGQCIYNTDANSLMTYTGLSRGWQNVSSGAFTAAQLAALTNVPNGQTAFNTTNSKLQYYNGGVWRDVSSGGGGSSDPVVITTSTDYSVQATDNVVVCNAVGADLYITLPLASTRDGRELLVLKTDASTHSVHIQTTGGEHVRTRSATEQLLTLQDDRVDIMPIAAVSMWYTK
jgi:hypothetical protein